ncbi:MAG: DNA-processing protein DprA [Actinomycetes bacterium]
MTSVEGESLERQAWIALAHVVEPGDRQVGRLVLSEGPRAVVDRIVDGTTGLRHQGALAARLDSVALFAAEERAASCQARIVTRADREWPSQLDDLGEAAPYALWVAGAANLRLAALRSVAMVGARACTGYGEEVARCWAAELAGEGWAIVSGGAFGIDAAAHRGALAADGMTGCVLAGGVDVPYPRAHDALIARIADDGLVVSESPMGESVRRQRFLTRNRVIAALTRATVVVEAAERSGTMATAQAATAMNRPLFAVPGPVTSPASAGCHRMIRDAQAVLVGSVDEILGMLDLGRPEGGGHGRRSERDALTVVERRVLDALPGRRAVDPQEASRLAGLAAEDTWAALGVLEAAGWVTHEPGGWRLAPGRA